MNEARCTVCGATGEALAIVIRTEYGHTIIGQDADGTLIVADAYDRGWRGARRIECGNCGHEWYTSRTYRTYRPRGEEL